jgi:hypothetical protein
LRPRIIHFVTGLSPDFGGKPFILPHALAILSARLCYPDHQIILWFMYEPTGPFWEVVKPYVTLSRVVAPTEIFGRPITHFAHAADVLRLRILLDHGGLYFDTDTLVLRPISDLPHKKVVMGTEIRRDGTVLGLCNAFIAAPPRAAFLDAWLERYRDFDATDWAGHSVRLPLSLSRSLPELIHVAPPSAFFTPGWEAESLREIFEHVVDTASAYSIHLWESKSWDYLARLTIESMMSRDTSYAIGARAVIAAFPELRRIEPKPPPLWRLRIALSRSEVPDGALHRSPFWYVGFHDEDGVEIARMDADHRELRRISADGGTEIVIERAFRDVSRPASWTVWPTDSGRRWLDRISGTIDGSQIADEWEA